MCIFRLSRGRKYFCGKRYPLPCSPAVCPFGEILWQSLINRDFKPSRYWLMPSMQRAGSQEEAWKSLASGEALYVVKEIVYRLGGMDEPKLRACPKPGKVS